MKEPDYYDREGFKVGDPVVLIVHNEEQHIKHMRVRRICKKTVHISWAGSDRYHGYVNRDNVEKGILVHQNLWESSLAETVVDTLSSK